MVAGDSADFGPYLVHELLGQGGMGVVHRAYDTVHGRVVALKRLPSSVTDREFRSRFQREARLAAALKHPNVVPVHDFGEIDGNLFLDMELIDGVDLRRALAGGPLDQERALGLLSQVAEALDAAHAEGLVHRDVKPANILIGPDDHVYLADFGIARETSPEATALTLSGDLIGSWDYMAPERLSGNRVDARSDQYSLACVLFECLTGRLPYPALDPAAKVAAHLLHPPPAPSVFSPTITPALDTVVLRGLAKEPERRFPSATALLAAAREAARSGGTVKVAADTAPGPSKERDQGRIVRAILRSTAVGKPRTLVLPEGYTPTSPYPGLSGFDLADAGLFHGRDPVVTELLVRLAEQLDVGEPVALVGASGSGKSSVLHAGLLPALAAGDGPDGTPWPRIVLTPGRDPIGNLAMAMARNTAGTTTGEWLRSIRDAPAEFGARGAASFDERGRPVIVVDQFEELFTHGAPEADRLAFATALANARPALVVLSIRADLVDRCIDLPPLKPALTAPVLLGAMDAVELRQAIVTPARDFGVDVEPGLPERLIADLGVRGEIGYDPGALPRLAHALRETWNHREGPVLTLAAYRRAGGIDGAVARTAEEIHQALDPAGRDALRALLLRLVTVVDGGGVARQRVDPTELGRSAVLDRLIAARLVTVDASGARLSHEALLTAWPRLRDWIDEDRAGLVQHRRFADSVRAWTESGQHDDDLYRGVRLAALTSWLDSARDRVALAPVEQEFLRRSDAAEHAGQIAARRRTRRLRTLVLALSLLLVVASAATGIAVVLQRSAQAARERADTSRQLSLAGRLAAESALARGVDPRRTAILALAAWQAAPTAESRSALLEARAESYRGRISGHEGAMSSVAVSADGTVAASGGRDGTLRLWDVPGRRQLAELKRVTGENSWYRTVSMSADGKLLTAANLAEKVVELWDVPGRKLLKAFPGGIDTAIAADGKTAVGYTDRGVVVWDTATFAERVLYRGGTSITMAYSPDHSLVATSDQEKIDVHRVSDGGLVKTLVGHTDAVMSLAFDPKGPTLASASMDGTVRLWDTNTMDNRLTLSPSMGNFNTVSYSPTGNGLVAGGPATSVVVWDRTTGALQAALHTGSAGTIGSAVTGDGHTVLVADANGSMTLWAYKRGTLDNQDYSVIGMDFAPDGSGFAAAHGGGLVRVWNDKNEMVHEWKAHEVNTFAVAYSPDGRHLVTVGSDGAVVMWSTETWKEEKRFSRPGTEFGAVAYSRDGTMIAVAGRTPVGAEVDRDEVLLLSAEALSVVERRATREEPTNKQNNEVKFNHPTAVEFSPDGRTLAVTLSGGKIGLWNLADLGSAWKLLPGHDILATDVKFSPDGTILASGGADRLIRLWRASDGQPVGELTGSDSTVRMVAFSPDGKTLATASQDTVVRMWDVASRQPLARLDRHGDDLNDVVFDPKGGRLASTASDGTLRLWWLSTDDAEAMLCGLLDKDLLAEEWRALGGDRGDPPKCP
ncbi:protein kinase [Actinosynnema sp. NPDC020468]|uniref:nSTAND1 domain-containing NTPase n=1 Tax=Actinosynnema sp. NPDC020468 TaxID=3154488 RepID=UPI00340862D6